MKLFLILLASLFILTGCGEKDNNKNVEPDINANSNTNSIVNSSVTRTGIQEQTPKEEELSSYSSDILIKDKGRQNNIKLTCDKLDGTVVESR